MRMMILRTAVALMAAALAGVAAAQSLPHQQTPSVDLSRAETRWRAEENWNDDDLVYTFEPSGAFRSSTGSGGRWLQTGARVVMDWPSYGAIYVGVMDGDRISGSGMSDDGTVFGGFTLVLER